MTSAITDIGGIKTGSGFYDRVDIQQSFVHPLAGSTSEATLLLTGIRCGGCVNKLQKAIRPLPGVSRFDINYTTHRARLVWDRTVTPISKVFDAIHDTGFEAQPFTPGAREQTLKTENKQALRRLGVAGIGTMQVMMLATGAYFSDGQMSQGVEQLLRWSSLLVTSVIVIFAGQHFIGNALTALQNRRLSMDVPVALAIVAAYLASAFNTVAGQGETYFESVSMFIFFLLTGRYLELRARMRAGQHVDNLARAVPPMAHRIEDSGLATIRAEQLEPGDQVLVKPGETVPADGILITTVASLDESMLTGESKTVEHLASDQLFAGTVNAGDAMELRVTQSGNDTRLSAIRQLAERAETARPQQATFADRIAGYFVAGVLLATAAIGISWTFIDPSRAFDIALATLVVSCPCALSLATPAAFTAATGRLSEMGLLISSAETLEKLARVKQLLFDKTGTLTVGKPQIQHVVPVAQISKELCQQIGAALERQSAHPLASAFHQFEAPELVATDIQSTTANGITGQIDGVEHRIGKLAFVADLADVSSAQQQSYLAKVSQGTTLLWLARKDELLAWFELSDALREDALTSVADLQQLGANIGLLSGDNTALVADIASELGINTSHGNLQPEQKLTILKTWQQEGPVGMIGDGINDAAVLAGADLAIAMGQGADLSKTQADAILLNNQLSVLPAALRLASRCQTVIRQNLGWALLYNATALPLAATGLIRPWMAALGMSVSSLVVVLNALRLSHDSVSEQVASPAESRS